MSFSGTFSFFNCDQGFLSAIAKRKTSQTAANSTLNLPRTKTWHASTCFHLTAATVHCHGIRVSLTSWSQGNGRMSGHPAAPSRVRRRVGVVFKSEQLSSLSSTILQEEIKDGMLWVLWVLRTRNSGFREIRWWSISGAASLRLWAVQDLGMELLILEDSFCRIICPLWVNKPVSSGFRIWVWLSMRPHAVSERRGGQNHVFFFV